MEKLARGKHSGLFRKLANYGQISLIALALPKTFFVHNLQIFVKARAFIFGKPFQSSLMLVGKVETYLSEEPFRSSILE
jgi:hypothetical protein